MKLVLMALAIAAVVGVGIPLLGGFFGGGDNEASRLVEATERTQNKADTVSRSYNDVIPPAPRPLMPPRQTAPDPAAVPVNGRMTGTGPGTQDVVNPNTGQVSRVEVNEQGTPIPPATPELTPGEHAVADAMDFLDRVHAEFKPGSTQYIEAVNRLKRAWGPRYTRAVDEYKRFEERVAHAEEMGFEYLEIQQRLTQNIQDRETREEYEIRDATEQRVVLDWVNQANNVLAQARAIKANLDDMNIRITKLELSATFAAVYEGFMRMPIAVSLLNEELTRFELETERIHSTFGPKDS